MVGNGNSFARGIIPWPQVQLPTPRGAFSCDYHSPYGCQTTYVCAVPHIRRLKSEISAVPRSISGARMRQNTLRVPTTCWNACGRVRRGLEWPLAPLARTSVTSGSRQASPQANPRPESVSNTHASLVPALYPDSARGSHRRGGRKPQTAAPRGLHSPAGRGPVFVSLPRQPGDQQDCCDHSRGDGHDWPGVLPARAEPARGVGGERALGRDGRQHVPAEGPQRRGAVPGDDPRRGDDHHRPLRTAQLQATSADLVPDPDQVPRRAAAQVRAAAGAAVPDEGRVLLRHRRGGPG